MKIETFNYKDGIGWSLKNYPKLDSKNTLILMFYAPQFNNKTELFRVLQKEYPTSQLVGCSTASEIYIEATLETLGHKSHLIGFYSYGEISPSGLSGCDLHNQTMTLTTFSERE